MGTQLFSGLEHQNFTLGSLLQKLSSARQAGRPPLASVMFDLESGCEDVTFRGLETEVLPNPHSGCRFDQSMSAVERRGQLELQCQYSEELFEASTIERWLEGYQAILAAMTAHPQQQVSQTLAGIAVLNAPNSPGVEVRLTAEAAPAVASQTGSPAEQGAIGPRPAHADHSPTIANPIEERLAQIWREVILVDAVERSDDFFDLGGHSLLATQVISRINRAFEIELPLRAIFEAPTLAGLAERITQARGQASRGPVVIPRREQRSAARELQQRLAQLSDAELEELLNSPDLKGVL